MNHSIVTLFIMSMPGSVQPRRDGVNVSPHRYIRFIQYNVSMSPQGDDEACAYRFREIYLVALARLKSLGAKIRENEHTGKTYDEVLEWLKTCVIMLAQPEVANNPASEKAHLRNIIHSAAVLRNHHAHYLSHDRYGSRTTAMGTCTICSDADSSSPSMYDASGLPPPSWAYP